MFEELKIRTFQLQIKQRIIWGLLIGLVTFSFGLAVAFLSFDQSVILDEASKIQDSLSYDSSIKILEFGQIQDHITAKVITNAP